MSQDHYLPADFAALGRRFLTLSGEEWYTANVALGQDPAVARASADRCLKAYLGEA